MGAYRALDFVINDILTAVKPQQQDWVIRFHIIDELRKVIESVESLRGATVEPFGSFVSNLFTRQGDLDISVQLPNGSYISAAGKKRKQALLGDLLIALREKGVWRRLQFIAHARVPILKIESKDTSISCDISIDNLHGYIKSKFLFWISEIDGRFRDMVLLVKEWAKCHDINNPKTGSFNSFALSLLVIFHFQTCAPAILPPLRDIYPHSAIDDLQGVRADAERQIAETCAANIARFKSSISRPNRSSLSELFVSFFAKFSGLNLKAPELGICPYTGQWEEIRNNMRWMPQTYALFIEDPFEQPENTARAVSSRQLKRISEAFEVTHHWLTSYSHNQTTILAALVRPHEVQFLTQTPVRNGSYKGGRLGLMPWNQRALKSPSQMQHQHQRTRNNHQGPAQSFAHSSAVTKPHHQPSNDSIPQTSTQQHHPSKPQQMWRPRSS
ncbi:protein HESO1 [Rhodamnia argentea]|uniref:Protein HESO1 n=1 Tax=Rhodamnia argentea TaxID=178133 RepID=A0A8B8PID6_9MYRT|nr:protein HESO1 [Rhodamnia argentea]XP_048135143.1 protein HESO1 [Rhodamnia argentea]XP_048135144.1 protein HESO1 [Rhodamnia argentea]XP_048135145.1 protein HESO1 [Rhodamnia argentea]XP_048135146.1 protein HESO1 [Rhodamnia argentea]XP_048135147.1 protein HESO1 [Rhodamnia argentea]XP_048135148.1 protein HESO1 [Rhodamnia argentea]XP_048135149.1 protein HESO1 [Rhodamnia argentea]XP_048135150.1 protein HESO1 [Rhodamnia argentea]XP_048135151.1 protein HESO1 [Rhodamnia argentea]XP_048135152.1 